MMMTTTKTIKSIYIEQNTLEGMMWEGTGDRVEATVLPAQSPRGLAHRGAGRWGSSAGMGGNSVHWERGLFVTTEFGDGRTPTMV